jgi:hypothetical protein
MRSLVLINKRPPNAQPKPKAICWIIWSRKIVTGKFEAVREINSVYIFGPNKCFKTLDPEIEKQIDVGTIFYCGSILQKELPYKR